MTRRLTLPFCFFTLLAITVAGCSDDKKRYYASTAAPVATNAGTETGVVIASATPDHGSALGGTRVTLTGSGFLPGSDVIVGGAVATNVTVLSERSLEVTTPAHPSGLVDIEVIAPNGERGRLNNAFTFERAKILARVADYGDPSGREQELLELINRARSDPAAEGRRLGIDLSAYPPKPPLSHNGFLHQASRGHVVDMVQRSFYGHLNPDGVNANGRIFDTGYDLHSRYGNDRTLNYTENLGAGSGNQFDTPQKVHDAFMLDQGINPPKHRNLILSATQTSAGNREAGIAFLTRTPNGMGLEHYAVQEHAGTNVDRPLVTGVVFRDATQDGIARSGEGMSGVDVVLSHTSGFSVTAQTQTAGGYAFEVFVDGDYTLSINGDSLPGSVTGSNVKVDSRDGRLIRR